MNSEFMSSNPPIVATGSATQTISLSSMGRLIKGKGTYGRIGTTEFKETDLVVFGRDGGEKTCGVIVKINKKTLKIMTTQDRGGRHSSKKHKSGSKFSVAPSCVYKQLSNQEQWNAFNKEGWTGTVKFHTGQKGDFQVYCYKNLPNTCEPLAKPVTNDSEMTLKLKKQVEHYAKKLKTAKAKIKTLSQKCYDEIPGNDIIASCNALACAVCLTNKKCVAASCGHCCMCLTCSKKLMGMRDKCPICRHELYNLKKVYL